MSETDPDSQTESAADEGRRNLLVPDVERWDVDGGEPIIELEDVHKSFGDEEVLSGLNLRIEPGKITVVIGASGSGKSVLIKHMNGLLKPDRGTVRLFGRDISSMDGPKLDALRKRIGTMFQNYALFDSMTITDNVAFPLVENQAMGQPQARDRAQELLEELGLGHAVDQMPPTLSGGMKKRVSLARAIVSNPELVLFDEPTTGLDPIMIQFVDNMVEEITRDYQLTSVLISHNMATIFRIADRVAVLHGGEIIAYGSPGEIRDRDDQRIQDLVGGQDSTDIEILDEDPDDDHADEALTVTMEGVFKSFGTEEVLRGVDFKAPNRELTTLIGGSGAGKSVMMKHFLGLLQPDRGDVTVFGDNLADLSERQLRKMRTEIGMLFQHSALFDSMSVRENVAFPLIERRVCSRDEAYERTDELLDRLRLADITDASPVSISSGQQKRVALARALIAQPKLLIYDEPTTGQDPIMSKYVEEMVLEVQQEFDVTSIVISHDMASAFRTADNIAMLHKGEIIAFGSPEHISELEDERVHNFVYAADVAAQERARTEG